MNTRAKHTEDEMQFTRQNFERWLRAQETAGLKPTSDGAAQIERIRACLRAGGTMTEPVQS